jgi:hypothetical protein
MPAMIDTLVSHLHSRLVRRTRWLSGCFVLRAICVLPASAFGQETARDLDLPVVQAAASPTPLLPGEIGPDTYLLPDKEGHLQRVLGFTYEDFIDAYKIQHQLSRTREPPRFRLQRLLATGTAEDGHARLKIDITIALSTEQSVGVPLGMPQALLLEPATSDGPGNVPVHFDTTAGGYVAWLRGTPGQTYHVVLHVLVPLTKTGGETALQIGMPRAASSELTMTVPVTNATAQVGRGSAIVDRTPVPGGTRWVVAGMSGDFRLAWQKSDKETVQRGPVLEASGGMLVRVDGLTINTDVRLSVRSFGGRFDRFRVRLPAGADLVAVHHPGYTVRPVDGSAEEPLAAAMSRVVEVQLDEKTVGPVDVQLITQQRHEPAGKERSLQLAGFEVIGAVRQFGHIAIQVIGDWHVQWMDRHGVVRVDELPEGLRHDDVAAGFEYFRQPFALAGRLIPRRTHVRVEPDYLILVGAHEVRLEARLRYTVRVKKAYVFRIDLAGWQFDPEEIGPPNLFEIDAVSVTEQGHVSIPLITPTKGQIELTIKLHQRLPEGTGGIRLPLPVPQDVAPAPATIVVLPDDNLQLIPTPEEMTGLTPQQIALPIKLPRRQQPPLCYRGDAEQARFVGQIRVHEQSVLVDVSTRLQIDRRGAKVDQTLGYQVAYEPVDSLALNLPDEVARRGDLQIELDGEPLPFAIDPAAEEGQHQVTAAAESMAVENRSGVDPTPGVALGEADLPEPSPAAAEPPTVSNVVPLPPVPPDRVQLQVALPEPKIGRFQLVLHYQLTWPESVTDHDTAVGVQLADPVAEVDKNQLSITTAATIQVAPRGDTWTVARKMASGTAPRSGIHLAASGQQTQLPLTLRLAPRLPQQSTIVERLWIQTWLTGKDRQDRAIYLLRTNASQLTVAVPNQVVAGDFMALLDGVPVAVDTPLGGQVTIHLADAEIPVSGSAPSQRHRLELRCRSHDALPRLGTIRLTPTRLDQDIWIQHAYWELILPSGSHLIDVRGDFANEWQWQWRRFGWRRVPVLTSAQLELWSGAALEVPIPAAAHRYLFSSVGRVDRMTLHVADRSLLVLIASSGALVAGLLLIYVPSLRQPRLLLVCVLLGLVFAVGHPDAVMLVGQAAILGVVLACLAAWLKLILRRHPRREAVLVSGTGSSVIGPISTTEAFAASGVNGGSSAPTRKIITTSSHPSLWDS